MTLHESLQLNAFQKPYPLYRCVRISDLRVHKAKNDTSTVKHSRVELNLQLTTLIYSDLRDNEETRYIFKVLT